MSTAAIRVSRLTATANHLRCTFATVSIKQKPSHHRVHVKNHVYQKPTALIGSFLQDEPPRNPKEAYAKLALLRREYAKQVKEVRKSYIDEVELQKQEHLRKVEARKAEMLRQKEERLKNKAAASQARAKERKASEDDFRSQLENGKFGSAIVVKNSKFGVEKKRVVGVGPIELDVLWDDGYGVASMKDYLDISREMIKTDGGPPR